MVIYTWLFDNNSAQIIVISYRIYIIIRHKNFEPGFDIENEEKCLTQVYTGYVLNNSTVPAL